MTSSRTQNLLLHKPMQIVLIRKILIKYNFLPTPEFINPALSQFQLITLTNSLVTMILIESDTLLHMNKKVKSSNTLRLCRISSFRTALYIVVSCRAKEDFSACHQKPPGSSPLTAKQKSIDDAHL